VGLEGRKEGREGRGLCWRRRRRRKRREKEEEEGRKN
jgi:hypothetical protein